MEKTIAMLFLSRDLAHAAHLRTDSLAEHQALGTFYSSIVDLADTLAESWMGHQGKKLGEIPLLDNEFSGSIDDVLEQQMAWIEDHRPGKPSYIENIIDEICALYAQTLYRLREIG